MDKAALRFASCLAPTHVPTSLPILLFEARLRMAAISLTMNDHGQSERKKKTLPVAEIEPGSLAL